MATKYAARPLRSEREFMSLLETKALQHDFDDCYEFAYEPEQEGWFLTAETVGFRHREDKEEFRVSQMVNEENQEIVALLKTYGYKKKLSRYENGFAVFELRYGKE